jgi:hypothetical protein
VTTALSKTNRYMYNSTPLSFRRTVPLTLFIPRRLEMDDTDLSKDLQSCYTMYLNSILYRINFGEAKDLFAQPHIKQEKTDQSTYIQYMLRSQHLLDFNPQVHILN